MNELDQDKSFSTASSHPETHAIDEMAVRDLAIFSLIVFRKQDRYLSVELL
jgi:hypothetical protein